MIKLFAFLMIFVSASAQAANYSAFVHHGILYVTVLGDTCNAHSAELEVDRLCRSDRKTRNSVVVCDVELRITSTEMFCGPSLKPHVFPISLKASKVAPEAEYLVLKYQGKELEIELK